MTVNRVCGSGAQTILSGAREILLGGVNVAVAGGMANMDLGPLPGGARPLGPSPRRWAALLQCTPGRAE
jgi:acetyl-CoA C-acetyltransferase